jgi:hypothetical protein
MDIPRIFNITESAHRIHNPFTPEKLATLGAALRLKTETRALRRLHAEFCWFCQNGKSIC